MKKHEEVIHLKNVSKHYHMGSNIVRAVDGVNLSIKRGDFVAVMGQSGSGKSTCMNMIGSLDSPTRGKIYLDNEDVSYLTESELAEVRGMKIGFIFQQFNLIPNLTVKENIMLAMDFQGVEQEEREDVAEELCEKVGLSERMNFYPNQLSGGQQQRVAIARSLANDPEVILADEPTGNLDTKTGKRVMNFLEELNREGKTIIMVTHDPDLAKKHADIVYWLKDGKIQKITRKNRGGSGKKKFGRERGKKEQTKKKVKRKKGKK